jgi:Asp-tRNA(Asn)/Glu-tRNA(Gln) amidotransferase A subunit family amidase
VETRLEPTITGPTNFACCEKIVWLLAQIFHQDPFAGRLPCFPIFAILSILVVPLFVPSHKVLEMFSMSFLQNRRSWMIKLSAIGIGGATFQRALAHKAVESGTVTSAMIQDSQWIADIELTDEEKERLLQQLQAQSEHERQLRKVELDTDVGPATAFAPYFFAENLPEESSQVDEAKTQNQKQIAAWDIRSFDATSQIDWSNSVQVAQSSIVEQAKALRSGKITSQQLAKIYLERIKRFDPILRCVVTLTEEHALQQAKRADDMFAAGEDRGILQGIPWGAKDIIAVPPFPTTWGGKPYRDQVRPNMATVAERLNQAGAVMLAKLSVGTYALGDVWYDATTKNPWNITQGSSGSSAGSASAVAAGLCAFAIGSETLGSIVSPTRRCRVVGLRPSFGRVSRFGCMPLSWTMDKIGPIARYAMDCGIVLSAIQGTDSKDPTVVERPLDRIERVDIKKLKIGFVPNQLSQSESLVLESLKQAGAEAVSFEYPNTLPQESLLAGLDVESASVFDSLFRNAQSEEDFGLWGDSFRKSQFVRGIHYVQSLRARTLLIQETERILRTMDVVLGGDDLLRTNLTGHPSMIIRCGTQNLDARARAENDKNEKSETPPRFGPRTVKLTAKFFGDAMLVAVGTTIEAMMPPEPMMPPQFSE